MQDLKSQELDSFLEKEEPEGIRFFLMKGEDPHNGLESHRAAVRFAMERVNEEHMAERKEVEAMFGKEVADRLHPFTCDIARASARPVDPKELLFVPNVLKKNHYSNKEYDSDWVPNDDNCGGAVPLWYAFLEPPHGTRYEPDDLRHVIAVLFPNGADGLEAYEWTTDWSDYFDDGHEWWGACCWSVYDSSLGRYVVMLASATD